MGDRGPVPNRSEQRRRANKVDIAKGVGFRSEPPDGDGSWHPVAFRWFESLKVSGQAQWYEASDWATAYLLAESMSRELSPQPVGNTDDGEVVWASSPPKGASLAAWLKAMSSLMVTEGDRRRLRVELEKAPEVDPYEEAAVADLASFRKRTAN